MNEISSGGGRFMAFTVCVGDGVRARRKGRLCKRSIDPRRGHVFLYVNEKMVIPSIVCLD